MPNKAARGLAAARMVGHLIALEHQRIGFITENINLSASTLQLPSHRDALDEAGLVIDTELVVDSLYTYRSGLDAAEQLLDLPHRPSASSCRITTSQRLWSPWRIVTDATCLWIRPHELGNPHMAGTHNYPAPDRRHSPACGVDARS